MVLKFAVGANPTLLYQSLISSHHPAAVLFPTCRLADKFRLGISLALPICPPTEVGGYEKKAR
jgi:hypothetical protein